MDGDPEVEAQLGIFSLILPLPFRVALIIVLAIWGWALNLHYLHLLKINVSSLINYTAPSPHPHHTATYRLASTLSATLAAFLLTFWLLTRLQPALVLAYDFIPITFLLLLPLALLLPHRLTPAPAGRSRLLATLRRVSLGGIAHAAHGKFGDILLADVLTSYSKVFGDLFVCAAMFLTSGGSATARPDRTLGASIVVPLIMAAPFAIRFRQCVIEYLRVARAPYKESAGWGGQHLANAAKYATAFPVIILSALQRSAQKQLSENGETVSTPGLHRAWIAAVLLNSLYSFYWDVAKDWDLTLFSPAKERDSPDHPMGLRRRLLIQPAPGVYYFVIVLDLLLRCTWSLKLSPHLDHLADFEGSIFVIEFLEVFRRWVWVFFRVETEWVRTTSTGLGVDDILLGDWSGKDDDDD